MLAVHLTIITEMVMVMVAVTMMMRSPMVISVLHNMVISVLHMLCPRAIRAIAVSVSL